MFRRARPCLFCKGLVYSLHLWNRILHTALFPKLTPRPRSFGCIHTPLYPLWPFAWATTHCAVHVWLVSPSARPGEKNTRRVKTGLLIVIALSPNFFKWPIYTRFCQTFLASRAGECDAAVRGSSMLQAMRIYMWCCDVVPVALLVSHLHAHIDARTAPFADVLMC